MQNYNVKENIDYCDDALLPVEFCQVGAVCIKRKFQKSIKAALIEAGFPASANIWIKKGSAIEKASDLFALASCFVTIQHAFIRDGDHRPGREYWSLVKELELRGVSHLMP